MALYLAKRACVRTFIRSFVLPSCGKELKIQLLASRDGNFGDGAGSLLVSFQKMTLLFALQSTTKEEEWSPLDNHLV